MNVEPVKTVAQQPTLNVLLNNTVETFTTPDLFSETDPDNGCPDWTNLWGIPLDQLGDDFNRIYLLFADTSCYIKKYQVDHLSAIDGAYREIMSDKLYMKADIKVLELLIKSINLFHTYVHILRMRGLDFKNNYIRPDKYNFTDEALDYIDVMSVLQDAFSHYLKFNSLSATSFEVEFHKNQAQEIEDRYERLFKIVSDMKLKVSD